MMLIHLVISSCTTSQETVTGIYSKESICQEGNCAAGLGKILVKQKFTYEGEFNSGLPEGKGNLTANGQTLYAGNWSRGLPTPAEERNVVRELLEGDGLEDFDGTRGIKVRKSSVICTIILTVLASAPRICIAP